MSESNQSPLNSWLWPSVLAAAVGAVGCAAGAMNDAPVLWRAYLTGFICVWLVTMGGMGLLALGNLTGGRWAAYGRPFYLALSQLIPFIAILFIPIALNLANIYPWASESTRSQLHLPEGKASYLEPQFFLIRAVIYFAVWLLIGWSINAVSKMNRQPGDLPIMSRVGALALVLLVPTVTFAAFDWGMSLEPNWYSSIYGALLTAGGVLAAHALAIVSIASLRPTTRAGILSVAGFDVREDEHEHHLPSADEPYDPAMEHGHEATLTIVSGDMGNLLLAFVMVWTYFALSQLIIIWSGNLPSEIAWYIPRLEGGWLLVAIAVALVHFAMPFGLLLSRNRKRDPRRLRTVALLLLATYCLHLYWVIVPAFSNQGPRGLFASASGILAVGGVWLALYSWLAVRRLREMKKLA